MELKIEVSQEYIDKIWDAVTLSRCPFPWYQEVEMVSTRNLLPGGVILTGGIKITVDNPDDAEGEGTITETFYKDDIAAAYLSIPDKIHCGSCELVEDPDGCTFDRVIQQAFFGEYVYG